MFCPALVHEGWAPLSAAPDTPGGRPIHRINYERTRYVYELHYKTKEISRELLDFCIREKVRECLPRARKRCDVAHMCRWARADREFG